MASSRRFKFQVKTTNKTKTIKKKCKIVKKKNVKFIDNLTLLCNWKNDAKYISIN